MTQRKPAGLSFHSWMDQQVDAARERGDFDNLPGRGQPLRDLDRTDRDWWIRGLMKREGLDFLPPTLQIRRDLEVFFDALPGLPSERAVLRKTIAINKAIRAANRGNLSGPASTVQPLIASDVVMRWRAARAARSA